MNAPNNRSDDQFILLDNFFHMTGSHNLSTGALIQRSRQNGAGNPGAHGIFTFTGALTSQLTPTGTQAGTGNAVADFLLGFPNTSSRCCVRGDGFRNYRKTDWGFYFQDDWKASANLTLNLGVRWEYFQPVYEVRDRFSMPDFSAAPATKILLAGKDGASRGLREGDWNNLAPRFGFAYSIGATRKTVVRGGYGIFYNPVNLVYAFIMSTNPPFVDRDTFFSSARTPELTLANAFPSGLGVPSLTFGGIDPHFRDAYNQNWNLTIQRDLGHNTVVSASYIGNKGVRLQTREPNTNSPQAGPGPIAPRRPIPGITQVQVTRNRGKSIYHALELKSERRYATGFGFLSSFVWSKCIDAPGNQINGDGSPGLVRDFRDSKMNRGLCQYDIRKRFATNFIYQLPFGRGVKGPLGTLAAGWEVTAILNLEDGQPFSARIPFDNSNTGLFLDHPDVVPGQDPNDGPKTPARWFNVNAFQSPVLPFTYGNAGRNIVIGPGVVRADFSVHKDFRLGDGHMLEFRTEFFNIFNRANFLQPGNTFGTPSFGVIFGAFDGRDVQFSLKYNF